MLLGVPNFSEGRDRSRIEAISAAFATGAAVLDTHSDEVHNRTVLTIEGRPGALAEALVAGARACVELIDMRSHQGAHPCIGSLDVCPVVWLREDDRDAAGDEARETARRIAAETRVPVFLFGELASNDRRRERAFFRDGGLVQLRGRMAAGELRADFGPAEPHPSAGATLVTARRPLAAFNVLLDSPVELAREIAAGLRQSGGGLSGVRAIGIDLGGGRSQVSTNVHDPVAVPLATVVSRVRELGDPRGARVAGAELVGLVPEGALAGFPADLALGGFDPDRQILERRLRIASE